MIGTERIGTPFGLPRRVLLRGGAATLALGAMGFARQSAGAAGHRGPAAGSPQQRQAMLALTERPVYRWSATSPATHLGDTYTLVLSNPGSEPVSGLVRTVIMDHAQHHNELVIQETFELAPGARREFTATNAYGTANHFSTHVATHVGEPAMLSLSVTLHDAEGVETCRFNERAFMIRSQEDLRRERHQAGDSAGDTGGHHQGNGAGEPATGA